MRIKFNINHKKTIEVILWVLNKNSSIDIYQLMKVLFHADLLCVNKYGSPITGDNYIAMKFGTVPEVIYNGLIKQDALFLRDFEEDNPIPFRIDGYKITPLRSYNKDDISESDIECLTTGIKEKNHANNAIVDWYDLIEEQYLKDDLSGGWSELMMI
jgi:hypothetical protein